MRILLLLLFGHALADYPLQGDFLSRAKRRGGIPGVPWLCALSAHALIHAGSVYLITNSALWAVVEFFMHGFIDYCKCEGLLGEGEHAFWLDQYLHFICKVACAVGVMEGLA